MPKFPHEYVVGLVFGNGFPYDNRVALIRKKRPKWQEGFLNGVGGKIEEGETPHAAMAREAKEEFDLDSEPEDWQSEVVMHGPDWCVWFFSIRTDLDKLKTMTDEELVIVSMDSLQEEKAIMNIYWLVPFCADEFIDRPATIVCKK